MAVQEAAPVSSGVIDLGPVRTTVASPRGLRQFVQRPGTLIFLAAFGLYVVVAALLVFRYSSFANDAQARTANAFYVMFSRDPHLAAIGFVWNPLPSLAVMPVLALKVLWPALARWAFAGNLVSAFFMAGAVVEVAGILRDLRAGRWLVVVLTACFALHPMIVLYGANGMSEAIFLFTLLVCARQLARWLESGELRPLVMAAIALAFAYLARNEAAAAAGAATLLVATVTLLRTTGDRRYRTMTAVVDATVFAAPFAVAFVGWAAASWIIVGHPFEQFSSVYGTASQLRVINASGGAGPSGPGHVVRQLVALVPLLPVIAGMVALRTIRRRDHRSLAHLAVFGAVVAFAVVAALAGQTLGSFRYYIALVPLAVVLTGVALTSPAGERWPRSGRHAGRLRLSLGVAAAIVLVGTAIPTSAVAMANPGIGQEEAVDLNFLFRSAKSGPDNVSGAERYRSVSTMSGYIDGKRLPAGSVILDTATPCVPFIVLRSLRPRQFVITNDRDFAAILADPVTFGARYLLVPAKGGYGDLDALNRAYPSLFADGAGFTSLEHEFDGPGCPHFRLYRVAPHE
jgi:hypothetical protein